MKLTCGSNTASSTEGWCQGDVGADLHGVNGLTSIYFQNFYNFLYNLE